MAWPPTTHQDVQDEVATLRARTAGAALTVDTTNNRVGLAGNTAPAVPVDIGTGGNAAGFTTTGTVQIFRGTQASPITTVTPGNQIRLVKFENISAATMSNNPANNDLTSPLAIYNRGSATSYPQVSCAWLVAEGGGPALGNDVGPLQAVAIGLNDAPYAAIGGYFDARKAFAQTLVAAIEATSWNNSGTDDTITATTSTLNNSVGVWVIARGASRSGAGVQIGKASGGGGFDNGIVVNSDAVARTSFVDWSTSTESVRISGTHTNAIRVSPGAGRVVIGSDSPTATSLLQVNDDMEILSTSKGVIMRSPDGTRWRATVENDGRLTTTVVP